MTESIEAWASRRIVWVAMTWLSLATFGQLGCSTTSVSPDPSAGRQVEVEFIRAENFVDVQLSGLTRDDSLAEISRIFSSVLRKEAARLPEGAHLQVRFTEIDLAGWIPPRRGREIRVLTPAYPARLEFDYVYSIPNGSIRLDQNGRETLTSFSEPSLSNGNLSQTLAIESTLLKKWMRKLAASGGAH